jgi:hypothetical protein
MVKAAGADSGFGPVVLATRVPAQGGGPCITIVAVHVPRTCIPAVLALTAGTRGDPSLNTKRHPNRLDSGMTRLQGGAAHM